MQGGQRGLSLRETSVAGAGRGHTTTTLWIAARAARAGSSVMTDDGERDPGPPGLRPQGEEGEEEGGRLGALAEGSGVDAWKPQMQMRTRAAAAADTGRRTVTVTVTATGDGDAGGAWCVTAHPRRA